MKRACSLQVTRLSTLPVTEAASFQCSGQSRTQAERAPTFPGPAPHALVLSPRICDLSQLTGPPPTPDRCRPPFQVSRRVQLAEPGQRPLSNPLGSLCAGPVNHDFYLAHADRSGARKEAGSMVKSVTPKSIYFSRFPFISPQVCRKKYTWTNDLRQQALSDERFLFLKFTATTSLSVAYPFLLHREGHGPETPPSERSHRPLRLSRTKRLSSNDLFFVVQQSRRFTMNAVTPRGFEDGGLTPWGGVWGLPRLIKTQVSAQ